MWNGRRFVLLFAEKEKRETPKNFPLLTWLKVELEVELRNQDHSSRIAGEHLRSKPEVAAGRYRKVMLIR